jgi:hypothetical protein
MGLFLATILWPQKRPAKVDVARDVGFTRAAHPGHPREALAILHLFLLTPLPEEVIFPFRSAPAVGALTGFPPFFSPSRVVDRKNWKLL